DLLATHAGDDPAVLVGHTVGARVQLRGFGPTALGEQLLGDDLVVDAQHQDVHAVVGRAVFAVHAEGVELDGGRPVGDDEDVAQQGLVAGLEAVAAAHAPGGA